MSEEKENISTEAELIKKEYAAFKENIQIEVNRESGKVEIERKEM